MWYVGIVIGAMALIVVMYFFCIRSRIDLGDLNLTRRERRERRERQKGQGQSDNCETQTGEEEAYREKSRHTGNSGKEGYGSVRQKDNERQPYMVRRVIELSVQRLE